ncbi:MAG: PilC/PilY family type IV pilus protein, partial [Gammaproteobacteria bacterium]|nr:PilC/PilY family type IV pilus protein [Gammaproteobacteria bacterium]
GSPGEALVMLNIDWRPSLGSQVCTTETAGVNDCQFLVDAGFMKGDASGLVPASVSFYELIAASLKAVIDPLEGLSLGMMINHEDENNCAGPNPPAAPCSNGGYVFKGFTSVDGDPLTSTCPLWPARVVEDSGMRDFCERLDTIPVPQGNESHKFQGEEHFFEFFRYLTGQDVFNGHNGFNDFGTGPISPPDLNLDDPADTFFGLFPSPEDPAVPATHFAELQWDTAVEDPTGTTYISPLNVADCSKIYTLNFMFQVSQQAAQSDFAIEAAKSAAGMGIDTDMRNAFGPDRGFTNVIRFLLDEDLADAADEYPATPPLAGNQNVTSYFIVDPTKINQTTNGYAQAGGTGGALALSDDPGELIGTLTGIFNEILSTSTTFVAPSIPANVFNRTELLPDFYMALFQAQDGPFWEGNLKKLNIEDDGNGNVLFVDVNGDPAIAPDGRIKDTALTFWTDPSELPDPVAGDPFLPGKDGRFVDRGGAGSRTPGFPSTDTPEIANATAGARQVFTSPVSTTNGTADLLLDFDATQATAQNLLQNDDGLYAEAYLHAYGSACTICDYASQQTADATVLPPVENEVIELVSFSRGIDVDDLDADGSITDARPWFVGAPPHSRPLAINYGARGGYTTANPDIRILMGSNDGFMHMYMNTDSAGSESGEESWAYAPRAVVPEMFRMKDNVPGGLLSYQSPSDDAKHPYLVDGEAGGILVDLNSDGTVDSTVGDRAIVFFGQRRGGKDVYALDVSDPDDPRELWTIAKGDTGFEELGQTWSQMRVGVIEVEISSVTKKIAALFITGGYNGNDHDGTTAIGKDERDDSDPNFVGSDDDEGNALFIINAFDGSLVWKAVQSSATSGPEIFVNAAMLDSAPSGVTLIDSDGDGLSDRFYYADTGGALWRGDIPGAMREGDDNGTPADPSDDVAPWTVTKILDTGRHFNSAKVDDRRAFHRPDVVLASDDFGDYDGVVFTTGDRAHPLGTETLNFAYLFKDRNTTTGDPPSTVYTHDDLADLTDNCLQDDNPSDCTDPDVVTKLERGWRVGLNNCSDLTTLGNCGEKGLANPLIQSGVVFFSTYLPAGGLPAGVVQCGPAEGSGLGYSIALDDASGVFTHDISNDDPITYERFDPLDTPGIPSDPVTVGTGSSSSIAVGTESDPAPTSPVLSTFWFEQVLQ